VSKNVSFMASFELGTVSVAGNVSCYVMGLCISANDDDDYNNNNNEKQSLLDDT
jgi:hypothetical protein